MGIDMKLNKMSINKSALIDILSTTLESVSNDTVEILKSESPVDNTTREKQKEYLIQGKRAWLKDNIESRRYWRVSNIVKSSFGGGVRARLTNPNPAVIALALGFISPLNKNAEPVERTPNGKFSEQDPNGEYALKSIQKALNKNGINNTQIYK